MHPERPNPEGSAEPLEVRLRSLPGPKVPGHLEAKLLGGIPNELPVRTGHWSRWTAVLGVAGLSAAACVAVIFFWRADIGRRNDRGQDVVRKFQKHSSTDKPGTLRGNFAASAFWSTARTGTDATGVPSFNWPVEEKSTVAVLTSIPADLFD